MASERAVAGGPAARARIVMAGIHCIVREGIAEASMASIAKEGGVSKALLHYHFADRAHLLAEIVTVLGTRIVERERAASGTGGDAGPVDVLWRWVGAELARGELYALLTAGTVRAEPVSEALSTVSRMRRDAALRTVSGVFGRLGLTTRVPIHVIADASVVFLDGLVLRARDRIDARLSFDVFWLAMLSLGEVIGLRGAVRHD